MPLNIPMCPTAAPVDTAPLYRALLRSREALIPVRSGASIHTIAEIDAILNAAPAGVQASAAPSDEWAEVERLRDLPEVDEALLNFKDDCTGDNAAMVVRAVRRAVLALREDGLLGPTSEHRAIIRRRIAELQADLDATAMHATPAPKQEKDHG